VKRMNDSDIRSASAIGCLPRLVGQAARYSSILPSEHLDGSILLPMYLKIDGNQYG